MALEDKPEIARRVIAARILKGWEQRDLGDAFEDNELPRYHAHNLEGEKADKTWAKLTRRDQATVAIALGVSLDYLTGSGPAFQPTRRLVAPDLPRRLRERRAELKLGQRQVAERLIAQGATTGNSASALRNYQKYEDGDTPNPREGMVHEIAKALEMDPNELFVDTAGPDDDRLGRIERQLDQVLNKLSQLQVRAVTKKVRATAKTAQKRPRKRASGR